MTDSIIKCKKLSKTFRTKRTFMRKARDVHAVSDVDIEIPKQRSVAVVGESGCGKSTLVRLLMRIIEPTSGDVYFCGERINNYSARQLRFIRRRMQLIHQNPSSALDPRLTVFETIAEGPIVQNITVDGDLESHVSRTLTEVGLPSSFLHRYPHELSGGQKQRICIARALAVSPDLLILDEPTSALDVSVQAQILEMLDKLRVSRGLSYVFISHDLAVVRQTCDFVMVMYLGRVVEQGPIDVVFQNPRHPYTQALFAAVPRMHSSHLPDVALTGDPPNPASIPDGCPFHPRCKHAQDMCRTGDIPGFTTITAQHQSACHFALNLSDNSRLPTEPPAIK